VRWDAKYSRIIKSWHSHWYNSNMGYPEDTRKAIYATNNLNSIICKATRKHKLFSTDNSARKVIYLAILDASKKWTMLV